MQLQVTNYAMAIRQTRIFVKRHRVCLCLSGGSAGLPPDAFDLIQLIGCDQADRMRPFSPMDGVNVGQRAAQRLMDVIEKVSDEFDILDRDDDLFGSWLGQELIDFIPFVETEVFASDEVEEVAIAAEVSDVVVEFIVGVHAEV